MEISERAENLLNKLDNSAAVALSKQKPQKSNKYSDAYHDSEIENNPKKL